VLRDERHGPVDSGVELGRAAGLALKGQASPDFFTATA